MAVESLLAVWFDKYHRCLALNPLRALHFALLLAACVASALLLAFLLQWLAF